MWTVFAVPNADVGHVAVPWNQLRWYPYQTWTYQYWIDITITLICFHKYFWINPSVYHIYIISLHPSTRRFYLSTPSTHVLISAHLSFYIYLWICLLAHVSVYWLFVLFICLWLGLIHNSFVHLSLFLSICLYRSICSGFRADQIRLLYLAHSGAVSATAKLQCEKNVSWMYLKMYCRFSGMVINMYAKLGRISVKISILCPASFVSLSTSEESKPASIDLQWAFSVTISEATFKLIETNHDRKS